MKLILSLLLSFITFAGFAQDGFDYGDNKPINQGKYGFIIENYQTERYLETLPRLQYLFVHAPNLHQNLYILGANMYEKAASQEKDSIKKIQYQDTVLWSYKMQLEKFKNSEALNYTGLLAYGYLYPRKQYDTLNVLYEKIVSQYGTKTFPRNLDYYFIMKTLKRGLKQIDDVAYINEYKKTKKLYRELESIDRGSIEQLSFLNQAQTRMEQYFSKYVKLNCDNITNLYPMDSLGIESANNILTVYNDKKCFTNPNYLKVLEYLYQNDKSANSSLRMAEYYDQNGEKTKAKVVYEDLVEKNVPEKGKASFWLMAHYSGQNRELTRKYARICIESNYESAKAHNIIAGMYQSSVEECKEKDNIVKTRSVFIAAYQQYKAAGNTAKMAEMKSQFPSKEDLFLVGKEVGQTINTGCWINEEVVLQTR